MKRTELLILGVGVAALYFWYRSRQAAGGAPVMAGQGTVNSGLGNPAATGQGGLTTGSGTTAPPVPSMTEQQRLNLRNAATGPGSRAACPYPGRWIDSVTAPFYGVCVDNATFNLWVSQPRGEIITQATIQSFLGQQVPLVNYGHA